MMSATGAKRARNVQPRKLLLLKEWQAPLQLVAVDILGPFPESEKGNSYILVIGDYFTRRMEAYPNQEAVTVAQVLT